MAKFAPVYAFIGVCGSSVFQQPAKANILKLLSDPCGWLERIREQSIEVAEPPHIPRILKLSRATFQLNLGGAEETSEATPRTRTMVTRPRGGIMALMNREMPQNPREGMQGALKTANMRIALTLIPLLGWLTVRLCTYLPGFNPSSITPLTAL